MNTLFCTLLGREQLCNWNRSRNNGSGIRGCTQHISSRHRAGHSLTHSHTRARVCIAFSGRRCLGARPTPQPPVAQRVAQRGAERGAAPCRRPWMCLLTAAAHLTVNTRRLIDSPRFYVLLAFVRGIGSHDQQCRLQETALRAVFVLAAGV